MFRLAARVTSDIGSNSAGSDPNLFLVETKLRMVRKASIFISIEVLLDFKPLAYGVDTTWVSSISIAT